MMFREWAKTTLIAISFTGLAACSGQCMRNMEAKDAVAPVQPALASQQLQHRVYYFNFDKAELSKTDRAALVEHAHYLKSHPLATIRIEGHADKCGKNIYNERLSQRRARAIARELLALGVSKDQMRITHYGSNKPAVSGNNRIARQKNRRAEITYEIG